MESTTKRSEGEKSPGPSAAESQESGRVAKGPIAPLPEGMKAPGRPPPKKTIDANSQAQERRKIAHWWWRVGKLEGTERRRKNGWLPCKDEISLWKGKTCRAKGNTCGTGLLLYRGSSQSSGLLWSGWRRMVLVGWRMGHGVTSGSRKRKEEEQAHGSWMGTVVQGASGWGHWVFPNTEKASRTGDSATGPTTKDSSGTI